MTGSMLLLAEQAADAPASLATVAREAIADPLFWVVVMGAAGVWLMLPGRIAARRWLGVLLGAASLGILGWMLPHYASAVENGIFFLLAGITLVAAAATVTSRYPVYSAIWFAVVLLGTAALFLYQGAQFLAVATIVVYAGAILVMFLFVLMLAQPRGYAFYDRVAWEGIWSASTAALLVGVLLSLLLRALPAPDLAEKTPREYAILAREAEIAQDNLQRSLLADDHVAKLGAVMFGRHLIAVEVAGVLLLAALVGAVAIVAQGKRLPEAASLYPPKGSASHA